jgi:hypothetical protein
VRQGKGAKKAGEGRSGMRCGAPLLQQRRRRLSTSTGRHWRACCCHSVPAPRWHPPTLGAIHAACLKTRALAKAAVMLTSPRHFPVVAVTSNAQTAKRRVGTAQGCLIAAARAAPCHGRFESASCSRCGGSRRVPQRVAAPAPCLSCPARAAPRFVAAARLHNAAEGLQLPRALMRAAATHSGTHTRRWPVGVRVPQGARATSGDARRP